MQVHNSLGEVEAQPIALIHSAFINLEKPLENVRNVLCFYTYAAVRNGDNHAIFMSFCRKTDASFFSR